MAEEQANYEINIHELTYEQKVEKLDEILTRLDLDTKTYKKFLIRDNRIVGMILLNEVDQAGVVLGLMRDKVDVTLFRDDLLREDFGAIHLPREIREEINTVAV